MEANQPQSYVGLLPTELNIWPLEIYSTEKLEEALEVIKRNKLNNENLKIVVTHSGAFHADEVLGSVLIKFIPGYANHIILRSRNKDIWNLGDIVIDVGGIFDPKTLRYDHHMSSFKEIFDENVSKINLSAAGLVYKYHGKEIITNLLQVWGKFDELKESIDKIYLNIYQKLILYVDGVDNGVDQYPESKGRELYTNRTSYGSRVSRLNPSILNSNNSNKQFLAAQSLAQDEFLEILKFLVFLHYPSYNIVLNSFLVRKSFHTSGRIMMLPQEIMFKEHLLKIEEEHGLSGEILYVLTQTKKEGVRLMTVPKALGSFEFRKGIFTPWRGLELEELRNVSGIKDVIFVHKAGFIGGAESMTSTLEMAEKSLLEI